MFKRILTISKCFKSNINSNWCKKCAFSSVTINCVSNRRHNLTFLRKFHFSSPFRAKLFIDKENAYAFTILPQLSLSSIDKTPNRIDTVLEFEEFLRDDWRGSNASAIVEAFEKVKSFCIAHDVNISDRRFDGLVDGLMDHCEYLKTDELWRLLSVLSELPPCESITSHNFHDVWSCLDDICCWKMGNWDIETMLIFADCWYKLNLGRLSDYLYEVIDKIAKKPHRLNKNLLLHTFFHINVCRRRSVPFDIEHSLLKHIDTFTVDELGVIALGYFKTRTKIKSNEIVSVMIKRVIENCDTIHEITLTAILKVIRLSQNLACVDEIKQMLDELTPQIERLSELTCVHVALVGTSLQLKHEVTLMRSTEKILKNIENSRLKDIERTLLANSMFNSDTNPSIYEAALKELYKESREKEMVQYHRCVVSALHYLSLRNIYSYELMDKVLNEDYINEIYGKSPKVLPRELFSLDLSINIECPHYQGHRLSPFKKYKAAKWLTEFSPTHDQSKKLTLSDKFYLDVMDNMKNILGGENLVRSDHILPHFSRPDIVICRDKSSGNFIEPFGFENYILGDVKWAFSFDKYQWYAIVPLIPNLTIRGTTSPLGSMVMKERQLRKIGYTPVFVFWNEFLVLAEEKRQLLEKKLSLL